MFGLLKQQSFNWDSIGEGLGVSYGFRQCCLKEGIMTSEQQKLEAVLNNWIESECSEVSWDYLMEVLIKLDLTCPASDMKKYLQTNLSAIRKYHWINST